MSTIAKLALGSLIDKGANRLLNRDKFNRNQFNILTGGGYTGEDEEKDTGSKTLGGIAFLIATLVGMWFTLQADIAEAKELPEPLPPDITRMEYDMKDQLIRQTIMTTQEDVKEVKEDIKRIEEKIDKLR